MTPSFLRGLRGLLFLLAYRLTCRRTVRKFSREANRCRQSSVVDAASCPRWREAVAPRTLHVRRDGRSSWRCRGAVRRSRALPRSLVVSSVPVVVSPAGGGGPRRWWSLVVPVVAGGAGGLAGVVVGGAAVGCRISFELGSVNRRPYGKLGAILQKGGTRRWHIREPRRQPLQRRLARSCRTRKPARPTRA